MLFLFNSKLSLFTAELKVLIQCAKDNNVDFVYALSPGLDMVFSEKADNLCLKAKLEQVLLEIVTSLKATNNIECSVVLLTGRIF